MKTGWQTKTLEDVCLFTNGLWKGEKPPFANVGVVRNTNFTKEGTLNDSDIIYLDVEAKQLEKRRLQFGDIILEKSGGGPKQPVGRVALFDKEDGEFSFSNFTAALRVRRPNEVDFRFLHKFLHWTYLSGVTERMQTHSTGIRNLDAGAYKAIEIPFPSLHEQKGIVGILDEAFKGIATAKANAEKNLQNVLAVFASHLQTIFTQRGDDWVEKPLAELCDATRVITYGVIKLGEEVPNGIPCLRTSNVRWLRIETDGMKRIAPALSSQYSRTILRGGEVLVNVRGTLGGVAVASHEMVAWNVSREVAVVPVNPQRVNPAFLSYLIGADVSQQWLGGMKKGAAYVGINIEDLRRLPVSAPKLDEQLEVVGHLESLQEEVQRLESLYEYKLAALDALQKSLLHRAFSGELTARQSIQVSSPHVTWPVLVPNISVTDLHAGILAMAFDHHEQKGKQVLFTHVKAEKIAHMVEAHLGIDLGRSPVKDAAGPNDFPHLIKVEHRARKANYFDFKRVGVAYRVRKLYGFDRLVEKTQTALGDRREEVEALLHWMLPLTVEQAEIVATVFAAWNNLLLDGIRPTDEQIVYEARENWHPDKLLIDRRKFFAAVQWLRERDRVPEGRGKRVSG
jgi:type I restriction enzyme, S subunit